MDKQRSKPLKPKEIKFIKAKVEGKTNIAAAQYATGLTNTGSAAVEATRMLKNANVQDELAKAFERHGITLDRAVKPISDGLDASKTVIIGKDENAFADEVPDHPTRLKAAGMAFNLMGLGKQNDGVTNNFLIITEEQKNAYGI